MSELIPRLNAALKGRYRIQRELGEGGMATVYLADDLRHERKVAVKVLKPELAAVVGAERFLAEIKTTASLQHPHILPLFDSGEAEGYLFYVMPYVEGETLWERLDREHQLPIDESVRIASDVAEALDYAHRQGVIHRDVKPANILLQDGNPVVSDFGIALAVSASGAGRITDTGLSLGTPNYMSPEQATGDLNLGPPTDIYALGCVLYEMLVGEPPFVGRTAQAVLGKIIAGSIPSAIEERPSVPVNVDAALRRAIEKLPADRFPTARDFIAALADPGYRHGQVSVGPDVTRAGGPTRWTALTGGLAIVLAVALGWSLLAPDDADTTLYRFSVAPPEGVTRYNRCCGPSLALSHLGDWLVFVGYSGGGGRSPLYRRHRADSIREEIPGTDDAGIPFFSPDDRWVGFASRRRLWRVPISGGPPQPITDSLPDNVESWGADWGDDDRIVYGTGGALYTVPAGGGAAARVPGTEGRGYTFPSFLPGGRVVLVTASDAEISEPLILALDLESGTADTLGTFGTRAAFASGYLVVSRIDGTLQAQPFDPARRRLTGDAVTIVERVRRGRPGQIGEFTLSSDGGLAFHPGVEPFGESLAIVGSEGTVHIFDPSYETHEEPAFSPDGSRVALMLALPQDVWVYDRGPELLDRFTVDGSGRTPVWTRDGTRLTFTSERDGGPTQLYWRRSDRSAEAERLLVSDFPAFPGSWLPGDRTLAFQAERESWDIGFLTVGDSSVEWVLASEANEIQPQVSPDGRWLAYASDRSDTYEVFVRPTTGDGGATLVSRGGGSAPRWSADGMTLFYVANPLAAGLRTDGTLMAASFTTDGEFRVTGQTWVMGGIADLNLNNVNYDVDPDGDGFVVVDPGSESGNTRGTPDIAWVLSWPRLASGTVPSR